MKRVFTSLIMIAALVSCSKSDIIEVAPQAEISFKAPFVDKATKVVDNTYNGSKLPSNFSVYGMITNAESTITNIFNGTAVEYRDADGTNPAGYYYTNPQYWVPGNMYDFAAVAPISTDVVVTTSAAGVGGMPTSIQYDATNQVDLLYSTASRNLKGDQLSYAAVGFTFSHLLSKVKFTFTNDYPAGYSIKVTGIQIVNAKKTATVNPATAAWERHDNDNNLVVNFGNGVSATETGNAVAAIEFAPNATCTSNYEKLIIPAVKDTPYTYQIALSYEIYFGGVKVGTRNYTNVNAVTTDANDISIVNKPYATVSFAPEAGNAYNITANLSDEFNQITFTVSGVIGWNDPATDKAVN